MNQITIDSIIQRNDNIAQAEIDGEIVMISIDNGEYYGLNPIASRIWEIIVNPLQVGALFQQLIEEYDVSEETCQTDVIGFVNNMAKNKVVLLTV